MPFEPDVLANACMPRCSKIAAQLERHLGALTTVAGGPGSRSNASTVGLEYACARASDVCSSRSARLASHTSVARSSTTQKSIFPSRERRLSIRAVRTQSGRCDGHCFS